jgi:hypothetical protein
MKLKFILLLCFIYVSCGKIETSNSVLISRYFSPPVKRGQIWVRLDSLNPFEPIKYDTLVVLEVKRNYAKVIWNGDTTSLKTEMVKCCNKRLLK